MLILAIDPGPEKSAICLFEDGKPIFSDILSNEKLLPWIRNDHFGEDELAIEMIQSYGMGVGKEVFDTCVWIGRFIEASQAPFEYIYRKEVKIHLCETVRATDSNIRYALMDRFGPGKEKAVGTKKNPGPLYGYKKDMWSALAVGLTYIETKGSV